MMLEVAKQRIRIIQCGRGGGKSTGAAIDIKTVVFDMPRSKNFILTGTFQQALTRTLPSTIKSLDMLGFVEGLHYFIGREAPRSWRWPKAYEPPSDPKHSIFFYNGTVYDLLSQDTNSRGGNYSSGMADEAQDLDNAKTQAQVIPTLRGEYRRFKDKMTYRRFSMYCSMPRSRSGEYIFEFEKLAQEYPDEYLYITAPSAINAHNLPPDWFTDQKRILMPSEYDIEILNIRPRQVIGGFYPMFDDSIHSYVNFNNDYFDGLVDNSNGYKPEDFAKMNCRQDADLLIEQPLEISMDYGAWINCIVTGQEQRAYEFKFISAMSINENDRFEDLLNQWCEYYAPHRHKTVYYWYDHTAKDHDARAEQYPEIVRRVLTGYGWHVIDMDIGMQPTQDDRYKFMGYLYKGDHPDLPKVSMNKHHCKYLIISLNGAKTKVGRKGFEKDKGDEKKHEIDQRTTTHFSDAHDTLLMGKYASRTLGAIYMPTPMMG
ncbi:MAG: hypothetical protein EOO89_18925 [Pedobacter sp.]|nr:MAG: hypothetical protein EOO89_18925 [Pedobacter sp.]